MHDQVSHERQRTLATVLLIANFGVGAISAGCIVATGWDLEFSIVEWALLAVLFGLSWAGLLVAAEFGPRAWDLVLSFVSEDGVGGNFRPVRPHEAPYYVGVWVNMLALALLTELTGYLPESPFTALFIAFVLTGQQVSRFRTQSGRMFLSGLFVAALMVAFEPLVGAPAEVAPHELTLAVIGLALISGGAHNFLDKPHNYLNEKRLKPPSRARIYLDGKRVWRIALFEERHRQDPVLCGQDLPASQPASSERDPGEFPEELKAKFEEYVREMAAAAQWEPAEMDWPRRCYSNFVVTFSRTERH